MYKNYIFTLVMAAITSFVNAQVRVNPNVVLPKDSVQSGKLIAALNDFLAAAQSPTKENKLIFEPEKKKKKKKKIKPHINRRDSIY